MFTHSIDHVGHVQVETEQNDYDKNGTNGHFY